VLLLHRQERRLHCLVGVEHYRMLLVPSERAKVHHPSYVAHLARRHLQELKLRFQGIVQNCNENQSMGQSWVSFKAQSSSFAAFSFKIMR
jgi:hypothetical protein